MKLGSGKRGMEVAMRYGGKSRNWKMDGEMMRIKGLLWKEWRQYHWYFMLAFLAIGLESILVPIIIGIYQPGGSAATWSDPIKYILMTGFSNTETLATIAAVLLAVLMLAGERGGTLNYLVTTPVSCREIIMAKFISGWLAIVTIMSILSLFFIAAQELRPSHYSVPEVMDWALITTAAMLCLFSLALLVASFTQGILPSALITMVIMGLPWMLISSGGQVFRQFYTLSSEIEIKLRYLETYLFIPDYISRDGRYIWDSNGNLVIDRVNPDYPLEIILLLLAAGLCLWLAIKVFEKNPLERRGEILLFGNFKQIGIIFISLLTAILWAGNLAPSPASYLVYFLIMWLGLYLVMIAGVRVIGWLAWYGWGRG